MNLEDFNKGEMTTFDHVSAFSICIGLTDDKQSIVIFMDYEKALTVYIYKSTLVYDALKMYTYSAQDSSLLWNRVFSNKDKVLLEEKGLMPSSLKELLDADSLMTASDVRYLNRDIPPQWKIVSIIDKTRETALNSILLVDYRINNLDILAVVSHKEDGYYMLMPIKFLRGVYKISHDL
jgi:hypothetical protein